MKDDLSFEAQFGEPADHNTPAELAEDNEPQAQSTDMTRGQQTTWIVGTIAIIGLAILYNVTRLPDNHPWKECEQIIGMDRACTARIAGDAIMRSY